MKKIISSLASFLLIFVASFSLTSVAKSAEYFSIGTGGPTGVYFQVGNAICKMVAKIQSADHGRKKGTDKALRCSAPSTGGSTYNIGQIMEGELQFGVAQSDWQYHAYNGTNPDKVKPFDGLRAVFSAHPEPFHIIARKGSKIKDWNSLKGKKVNIGNPGSGQRGTMDIVMAAKGWTKADFKLASELKGSEQSKALCDNKLDAMIYVVGHPSGAMKEATTTCDSVLVNVDGPVIDKLVKDNPYYKYTTIPGGMYRGNPNDIKTFGVAATFVTSSKVSEKVIYAVVKSVFENFETFKKLHPAFANLTKKDMINNGNSAPLHRGAIKYYKEAGLL